MNDSDDELSTVVPPAIENEITSNNYSYYNKWIVQLIFMARRAIPMIAFPRGLMYIYKYVCVTCATMRCIRS